MGDEITRWWSPPGKRVGVRALRFDFSVSRPVESEPARVAGAAPKAAGRESAGVRVARSPHSTRRTQEGLISMIAKEI